MLTHIGVAVFLGVYLWFTGRPHAAIAYALLVGAYAVICKCLHPLDVLLIFLGLLFLDGMVRFEPFKDKEKSKKVKQDDDDEEAPEEDADHDDEKFDGAKDAHVDLGTTFMTAYNKLNPDQVASMRQDTKELMETQRQLMETLTTMGPAIEQGMGMIDSFKQYFGKGTLGPLQA